MLMFSVASKDISKEIIITSSSQFIPIKLTKSNDKASLVWKSDFFDINRSDIGSFATHNFTQERGKCTNAKED